MSGDIYIQKQMQCRIQRKDTKEYFETEKSSTEPARNAAYPMEHRDGRKI